jgi:hypothetical protein
MMRKTTTSRRGVIGSLWALLVLSVVIIFLSGITVQMLTNRRLVQRREYELQTTWLARSGVEAAAGRLLADPSYEGETLEPLPKSRVVVKVSKGDRPGVFVVKSEATYPVEHRDLFRTTRTQRYQRTTEKGQVRLTPVQE